MITGLRNFFNEFSKKESFVIEKFVSNSFEKSIRIEYKHIGLDPYYRQSSLIKLINLILEIFQPKYFKIEIFDLKLHEYLMISDRFENLGRLPVDVIHFMTLNEYIFYGKDVQRLLILDFK